MFPQEGVLEYDLLSHTGPVWVNIDPPLLEHDILSHTILVWVNI